MKIVKRLILTSAVASILAGCANTAPQGPDITQTADIIQTVVSPRLQNTKLYSKNSPLRLPPMTKQILPV
jgi:hypothetical protein